MTAASDGISIVVNSNGVRRECSGRKTVTAERLHVHEEGDEEKQNPLGMC